MLMRFVTALLAPLRWLARLLLALLILFEEWGWEPLQRLMAALGRLPLLRQAEAALRRLPPYAALVVLVLPSLLILPVKLLALWLIGQGKALLGLAVIIVAKVVGTAVLARIFHLIQPALLQLPWFARFYQRWLNWKTGLLAWARATPAWRLARALRLSVRRWLRWMRRRA